MTVKSAFNLPDHVARELEKHVKDLSRLSFEKLIFGLYRERELTHCEAMETLGLPSRVGLDELLARHNLHREAYRWQDFLEELTGEPRCNSNPKWRLGQRAAWAFRLV